MLLFLNYVFVLPYFTILNIRKNTFSFVDIVTLQFYKSTRIYT